MKSARAIFKYTVNLFVVVAIISSIFIYSQKEDSALKNISTDAEASTSLELNQKASLDIDVSGAAGQTIRGHRYAWSSTDPEIRSVDPAFIEFGPRVTDANFRTTYITGRTNTNGQPIDWEQNFPGGQDFSSILTHGSSLILNHNGSNPRPLGYYYVADSNDISCEDIVTTRFTFKTNTPLFYSPGGTQTLRTVTGSNTNNVNFRLGRGKVQFLSANDNSALAIVQSRIFYTNVCTFSESARGTDAQCATAASQTTTYNTRLSQVSFPITLVVAYDKASDKWTTIYHSNAVYRSAIMQVGNRYDALLWGIQGGAAGYDVGIIRDTNGYCDRANANRFNMVWSRSGAAGSIGAFDRDFGGKDVNVGFRGITNVFGASPNSSYYSETNLTYDGLSNAASAYDIIGNIQPHIIDDVLYVYALGPGNRTGYSFIFKFNSAQRASEVGKIMNLNGQDIWRTRYGENVSGFQNQVYYRKYEISYTSGTLNSAFCNFPTFSSGSTFPIVSVEAAAWNLWGGTSTASFGPRLPDIPRNMCIGPLEKHSDGNMYIKLASIARLVNNNRDCNSVVAPGYNYTADAGIERSDYNNLTGIQSYTFTGTAAYNKIFEGDIRGAGLSMINKGVANSWFKQQPDTNTLIREWTQDAMWNEAGNIWRACKPNSGPVHGPRPQLAQRGPLKVPLIEDGHYLTFNPPQANLQNTGGSGFYDNADSPSFSRQLTNAEVQDAPILRLFASYMAGAKYLENGITKNIIVIADNGGVAGSSGDISPSPYRVIWIGGENITGNPSLTSLGIACADPNRANPYRIRFSIRTAASVSTARITENTIYLLPKGSAVSSIPFSNPSSVAGVVYVDDDSGASNAEITITNVTKNFSSTADGVWDFDLNFNKNGSVYESFYNAGGFKAFVYVADNRSLNNLSGGNVVNATINSTVDPFESCAKPYFATSGGDFRSNEPGSIAADSYTFSGNKFWHTSSDNRASDPTYGTVRSPYYDEMSNINNSSDASLPFLSDFGFEINLGAGIATLCSTPANLYARINIFCNTVRPIGATYYNTNINQKYALDNFIETLNTAANSTKTIKNVPLSSSFFAPVTGNPAGIYGGGSVVHELNLNRLLTAAGGDPKTPVLVKITAGTLYDIIIVDSASSPTPDNLIIWCSSPACVLRIRSLGTVTNTQVSANKFSYTVGSLNNITTQKSRIYLNYNAIDTNGKKPDNNPADPSRKVILDSNGNNAAANYYLGNIMTNGFVYNDKSEKTSVVKGAIIAKGVAIQAWAGGIKDMLYKDFPNPFLFIDYDPKTMIVYRGLLARPASDVTKKFPQSR